MGQAADRVGTLGILGGGQLARMTALAARRLGYATHVLDPSARCPASSVVEKVVVGSLDDAHAVLELAGGCDVVTVDTEHVPARQLALAATRTNVYPAAHVLAIIQDRCEQKTWLSQCGFAVGQFAVVRSERELEQALHKIGGRVYIKRSRDGYDGRGQGVYDLPASVPQILMDLGTTHLIVERAVPLVAELSVLVARGIRGELVSYPPSWNFHKNGVLAWSALPAPLPARILEEAQRMAREVALAIDLVGILCVEMFLTDSSKLLINELAPRPHNSFHTTERACATSQFEQLVRAVCDLPLGNPELIKPAAIYNLLGELWHEHQTLDFARALSVPTVTAHMYGKSEARVGRKMGHLAAVGETSTIALQRVLRARDRLLRVGEEPTRFERP